MRFDDEPQNKRLPSPASKHRGKESVPQREPGQRKASLLFQYSSYKQAPSWFHAVLAVFSGNGVQRSGSKMAKGRRIQRKSDSESKETRKGKKEEYARTHARTHAHINTKEAKDLVEGEGGKMAAGSRK